MGPNLWNAFGDGSGQYAASLSVEFYVWNGSSLVPTGNSNLATGIDFNGMSQNGLCVGDHVEGSPAPAWAYDLSTSTYYSFGPNDSMATTANSNGYVVGCSGEGGSGCDGFIWNEASPTTSYSTIPSLNFAWGISQNSQLVAGQNQSGKAAVYNTSSTSTSTYWTGEATFVNDNGLVVGDTDPEGFYGYGYGAQAMAEIGGQQVNLTTAYADRRDLQLLRRRERRRANPRLVGQHRELHGQDVPLDARGCSRTVHAAALRHGLSGPVGLRLAEAKVDDSSANDNSSLIFKGCIAMNRYLAITLCALRRSYSQPAAAAWATTYPAYTCREVVGIASGTQAKNATGESLMANGSVYGESIVPGTTVYYLCSWSPTGTLTEIDNAGSSLWASFGDASGQIAASLSTTFYIWNGTSLVLTGNSNLCRVGNRFQRHEPQRVVHRGPRGEKP